MIIANSKIGMESVRNYSSLRMDAYSTSIGTTGSLALLSPVKGNNLKETTLKDVSSSGSFKESMNNLLDRFKNVKTSSITQSQQEKDAISRIKTECINYLLWILFGDKEKSNGVRENYSDLSKNQLNIDFGTGNTGGFTYNSNMALSHYYSENESVTFNTKGTVVTADGREIDFGLSFSMSRAFEEYTEEYRNDLVTAMCDPLVINFDTDCVSVSDQKIVFDIDCDGVKDSISALNKGSGYLALDKNGDGCINDGNELFGTQSQDGFKDLSIYDSDGNGWIDEADPIWDKLLIACMNEDGTTDLYGLSEKNVGAIFLGNVSSDFSLNNAATNETNAAIRKTGVFLFENGAAGTMQHIDVAK